MFGADPGAMMCLPVRWRKIGCFWRMKVVARASLFGEVGIFTKLCIVAGFFGLVMRWMPLTGWGSKNRLLPSQQFEEAGANRGYAVESLRSCEWSREGSTSR